jgi:hypothetical protein
MDEIVYDWDCGYSLKKISSDEFVLNKLYIGRNYVIYKTECRELASGIFEQVEKLYELLEE